jgi:hypothetical protein
MATQHTTAWNDLAHALRELHRALMERARRDYESEHGAALSPGQLLELLTIDAQFAWLRGLSELMVDIDVVRDAERPVMDELASAVRGAIEHLLSSPGAATGFAQRYWPCVHDDPHVAMTHAEVKRVLSPWPRPPETDAASLLHERHRLAEKARHQSGRRRGSS